MGTRVGAVCLGIALSGIGVSAAAQTARLESDAATVIATLSAEGVTSRGELIDALSKARALEPRLEYDRLRALGISATDGEFDLSWQNQADRSQFFAPYDIEEWTTDVLRSWARLRPREAFTWLYAVRTTFGFTLPRRQALLRITQDWARGPREESDAAAEVGLSLRDPQLRNEVIAGVARGRILNGDARGVEALMSELTDEDLLGELRALSAAYLR